MSAISNAQVEYEGYILCIDNTGEAMKDLNEYFFIPNDYLHNNLDISKETLMLKNNPLEYMIKKSGGIRFYKYIHTFSNGLCLKEGSKSIDVYNKINFKFGYFHYDGDNFEKIKKDFFLSKIKRNKFYLSKVSFKGCILIDKSYLKSKVEKMYIYDIQGDILPVFSKEEKKKMINFIKRVFCKKNK